MTPNMLHPGMEKQEPVRYPFHKSMEDLETSLSHFYDVQALSLRTALFRLAEVERREGFRWRDTFFDHHPGDSGNRMMAGLAVFLVRETAMDLLLSPHRPEEAAELNGPLLEPMYDGNEPPASTMCAVGTSFQSMVTNATEFNFMDEGRGNWGFVATQPGAELVVRLDTRLRVIHGGGPAPSTAQVYFHCLKPCQHMGRAECSCSSNCTCTPMVVDGHHDKFNVSQTYLAPLLVSASADCRVAIRVLHDTSSGEHKFKVSGLVVAEDAQAAGVLDRLTMDHGRMPEGVFEDRAAEKTSVAARQQQQGAGPPPPGPAAVGQRR